MSKDKKDEKPPITGFEGEPGSYVVVDGKRVPNTDAAPVTITPDHPDYAAHKERAEAELKAAQEAAKKAKEKPAPAPTAVVKTEGGK